jgi:hypothetical protein
MRRLSALLALLLLLAGPARAAPPDATDFLFRLGMLQGHLMIGRELIDAGQTRLAMPHFGHPVRELYDDIAPWLDANKVPSFEASLVRLEAAVASAPRAPATLALYDQVFATLQSARATTPAALRDSIPQMIQVCADTIDAAAGEFSEALKGGRIDSVVEYHDSRGFLSYVAAELDRLGRLAGDTAPVQAMRGVLARAQRIVDPLIPGTQPKATVAGYRAVAADAARVAGK